VKSSVETKIDQTLRNIGSNIEAGGGFSLTTTGDATFAGANINVGGDAFLDIGGNTNILAVVDYDYSYCNKDTSSWGGLVKEKHIIESSEQKLQGSAVNVQEGLTIHTGNNLNLVASNIHVGGSADIDAGNNINILSADQVSAYYEVHQKTNYIGDLARAVGTLALASMTGGTSLLAVNEGFDVGCSEGKCSASMIVGSQVEDENITRTTTAIGSAIHVGGDLSMNAKNDITIKGSDIVIGGDGIVSAGNNINIIEAKNTTEHTSSHSETTITSGVQVGNAYVDVAYAAYRLYEATQAVDKATEALQAMKDKYDEGKASADAVRDAERNLAMATANLANATLALVASIAGAATAASSSYGTGMYASASVNLETNKSSTTLSSVQSVSSNIFGENIAFISGNDMNQIGSNVIANNTLFYDIANDFSILSSTDTYRTTSGTETIMAGGSVGNNAVQVNVGYNQSQNVASGTTHNNSSILAENIIINTGNNATFAGANVNANSSLDMSIGGDLTVESKQDSDYAKGSNWGVNAGIGIGYGTDAKGNDMSGNRNGSGGFNIGSSNHDSAWVNDMTELTGGTVNIHVGGKTSIVGAMIAAGAYDESGNFVDNGSLALKTNELEYKDLYDFNTSNENGFGLSASTGSTTLTAKDTGEEKKQTTHATIGQGNITVGGEDNPELAKLNRDTDKAQEITKDIITGALN